MSAAAPPRRYRIGPGDDGLEPAWVRAAFDAAGWCATPDRDYDIFWDGASPTVEACREVDGLQRYSHLWGASQWCDARRLWEELVFARERLGPRGARWYDFVPRQFSDGEPDEYRSAPHRLDGQLYRARLFVLVETLDPLVVHVSREGLCCRVGMEPIRLRARLRADGVDDDRLWRRIGRMAALALMAARDSVLAVEEKAQVSTAAGFELLALELAIDESLRPWLLGFRLAPLGCEGNAALEREAVEQALVLLGVELPSTELFERVLPSAANPDLLEAFIAPRWGDVAALRQLVPSLPPPSVRYVPEGVAVAPLDDHLALVELDSGALAVLDPAGGELWRALEAGGTPAEIAAERSAGRRDPEAHERDVWDTVADWVYAGLFRREDAPALDEPNANANANAARTLGAVAWARRADGSDVLCITPEQKTEWPLPDESARVIEVQPKGTDLALRRSIPRTDGVQQLIACGLRAEPNLRAAEARAFLQWLASREYRQTYWPVEAPHLALRKVDRIALGLEYVASTLERHGIWYSLAYGTLLGAVRHGDIIPWDYDLDFIVRSEDAPRIFALNGEIESEGGGFSPLRYQGKWLALNPGGVSEFWSTAIAIQFRGYRLGELYAFHGFSDGVLRRFDLDSGAYWSPHSSFPGFFVESESRVQIRGREYSAFAEPEKWLEGTYGPDWRSPYRARSQGGAGRHGVTYNSDRYAPKLRSEVEWCMARGWDRSRYRNAPGWPREIGGAGPVGPTPRTVGASRALWWRDLDELKRHY